MSTWNQPLWDGQNQPGTADNKTPFPELYIRLFLNDYGQLPNELTPLKFQIDDFIVEGITIEFTLSQEPSSSYNPVILRNANQQIPTINYTINSRTVSFPEGILQVGDIIQARYAY